MAAFAHLDGDIRLPFHLDRFIAHLELGPAIGSLVFPPVIRMQADVLHRPLVLPKVPEFGLKLMMGEMSEIVLASQRVSAEKVLKQGFQFEFPELKPALESFYGEEA